MIKRKGAENVVFCSIIKKIKTNYIYKFEYLSYYEIHNRTFRSTTLEMV